MKNYQNWYQISRVGPALPGVFLTLFRETKLREFMVALPSRFVFTLLIEGVWVASPDFRDLVNAVKPLICFVGWRASS